VNNFCDSKNIIPDNQKLSFCNLLSSKQITRNDINLIFSLANKIQQSPHSYISECNNLILASLFFEPSTRTRFSFESAMLRLGGKILSLEGGSSSSIAKGESFSDMGRMINNYADIAVIRNPIVNSINEFCKFTTIPVINAGDGANEHPTQALIDLYTIFVEKKRLENLKIVLVGDLKHSRSFHSFLNLIIQFDNIDLTLVSSYELRLDGIFLEKINEQKNLTNIHQTNDLKKSVINADILYVSRIQKERFSSDLEYEKVKNYFFIDKELIDNANKEMIIIHALPKVNEIAPEIDEMPQAKYFNQASYAVFVRMALLILMKNKQTYNKNLSLNS
jgi:aspartate carbamoyltransferase catalytic subunit